MAGKTVRRKGLALQLYFLTGFPPSRQIDTLKRSQYLLFHFLQAFIRSFWFCLCKVQVIRRVDRNKMDMRMRHFQTNHRDTTALALECFLNGFCNGLSKKQHLL